MKILGRATLGLVVLAALAACSFGNAPLDPSYPLDLGVPGEVVDVTTGVEFYPACGNESLSFGGDLYFPFEPSNRDEFPDPAFAQLDSNSAPSGMSRGMLPAVVAPGPGDDTGTLTQFEGGFAYWVSDSGRISTWLTTRELIYNWVC